MKSHGHDEHHEHTLKELLKAVLKCQKRIKKIERTIVIAQADLTASASALTTAANAIIAALSNDQANSTPDASVAAFKATVDGITGALTAAIVTPPPPTP